MQESKTKEDNKLIVTMWNEKPFLFLLNQNRMFYAYPINFDEENYLHCIFVGRIQKIITNIQACFVEFQKGKFGFLPYDDCLLHYPKAKAGDEILVQVSKEAIKTKLPMLTCNLNIFGKYFALKRGNGKKNICFSGQMKDSAIKKKLLSFLEEENILTTIGNYTLIFRTKAKDIQNKNIILDELDFLTQKMDEILHKGQMRTRFTCLYRGNLGSIFQEQIHEIGIDFNEIITDSKEIYDTLVDSYQGEKPIRFYLDESYSLHHLYGIDNKVEMALNKRIWLKSGAYLIIEYTEAMTVIDVNTGKYIENKGKENTAFKINKEACKEVALQMKLRNLSGMILVDFINMNTKSENQELIEYMKLLTKDDPILTDIVDITPLGIMEITRKKHRRPLHEELGE